jgi:hypothetical protein
MLPPPISQTIPADRIFVVPTVNASPGFSESSPLICDWPVGGLG